MKIRKFDVNEKWIQYLGIEILLCFVYFQNLNIMSFLK